MKTDRSSGTWRKDEDGWVTFTNQTGSEEPLHTFSWSMFFEATDLVLFFRAEVNRYSRGAKEQDTEDTLVKTRTIKGEATLQDNNKFGILSEDGHVRRGQNKLQVSVEEGPKPSAFISLSHDYERKYDDYIKLEDFDAFLTVVLPTAEFDELWDFVRQNRSDARLWGSIRVPFLSPEHTQYARIPLTRHTFLFEEGKYADAGEWTINVSQKKAVEPPLGEDEEANNASGPPEASSLENRLEGITSQVQAVGHITKRLAKPLNIIVGLLAFDILLRLFR
jgi:hypothetical protein